MKMNEYPHAWPEDFKAGFACIVGRPNTGKSTLTNALVGQKVAITSNRPETTRRTIRAIVNREEGQIILVDTPGLHRPRTLLGERLNDMVRDSLSDVDAIVMCIPADEAVGPGDRFLLGLAVAAHRPMICAVTKVDKAEPAALAAQLQAVSELASFETIVPVCATTGENVEVLRSHILAQMPLSPPLYPRDAVTDESEETLICELIREAALEDLREELPHSIAITVDEIRETDGREFGGERGSVTAVFANIHVERDSQKGIIIGRGGSRLKKIKREARHSIENLLGGRFYLSLHVRIAKDWQRDPKQLGRLGF